MFLSKSFFKPLLTALTLAACTLGVVHTIAMAQGTPGLVIFGDRDVDILSYYLDREGRAKRRDRYHLKIPKKKLENGAIQFVISYPDYFKGGKFNTDKIEVRIDGDKEKTIPLKEVIWDEDNRFVQIDLAEPLREPKKLEIVMSDVKNPAMGTYYLYAQVFPAVNAPVPELIGAWVISINP